MTEKQMIFFEASNFNQTDLRAVSPKVCLSSSAFHYLMRTLNSTNSEMAQGFFFYHTG